MASIGSELFWGTCDVWFSSIQSSDGFELVFRGSDSGEVSNAYVLFGVSRKRIEAYLASYEILFWMRDLEQ